MSVSMANPHVHAKFIKNELMNGVIFYTIEVSHLLNDNEAHKSKKVWQKTTRYSNLLRIHQMCKAIVHSNIPEFPPKKWFGNTDTSFVEMRQTALQNYFNILLKFVKLDHIPPLRNFLFEGVDLQGGTVERKTLTPKKAESDINLQGGHESKSLQIANHSIKKGDILADLKDKFIEIGKLSSPEEDERDRKREIYSKKLKYKPQSHLLEKLVLPKGNERNLTALKHSSVKEREIDLLEAMDENIMRISKRIEKEHSQLFVSGFIHINQN